MLSMFSEASLLAHGLQAESTNVQAYALTFGQARLGFQGSQSAFGERNTLPPLTKQTNTWHLLCISELLRHFCSFCMNYAVSVRVKM